MISLISILAAWSIVSSVPFDNGMVTSMTMTNDTLYVGGGNGKSIQSFLVKKSGELTPLGESEPLSVSSYRIREIKVYGDYIYACTRSNGYGLHVDLKRPDYISPFEGEIGFENSDLKGQVQTEFVEDPCPSRFCKSLRIVKAKGNNHCIFSHAVPETENNAEFIFWLKVPKNPEGTVSIPLLKDVLSVHIDKDLNLGLTVQGENHTGKYACGGSWINVKVSAKNGRATLSVRGIECPEKWTEICSSTIKNFSYESICCGLEGKNAAEVQIDEYVWSEKDLGKVSYINGKLVVLDKKTLKIVNRYNMDLRCLSLHIEGNTLYMGMIGGVNIYDLSTPASPRLTAAYKDAGGRTWTYPGRGGSNYKYRVPGEEYQHLGFTRLPDGRKILVAGCDVSGIELIDVTDPCAPKLFKHINTIPRTALVGSKNKARKYIEWDVHCDYPYVYSTAASLHSLVHNEYFNGKQTAESWTPDIYGLKVYDISDPDNIKDTLIRVSAPNYPTHIAKEGDSAPSQMTRIGDRLYLGFADKGIAVFKAGGFSSEFEGMIKFPENNRVRHTCGSGDRLIAGGGGKTGPWTECRVFSLRSK